MASFLLDGLLAALLVATIIYAVMLDRRLRTFRQARDEMQALLANFTAATVQAQSGIAALRDNGQNTSAELKGQLERGKALRDDLAFLLDRGAILADRLEKGIGAARTTAKEAEGRIKPAPVRIAAEAAARQPAGPRPAPVMGRSEPRLSELRADLRVATERADRRAAAEPADAARDFLRALKTAR
jgi:hypothetical protein